MPPKQKRKGLPNKFYWADVFFPSFFKISGSQLLCFFAFQLFCFSLFLCFSTFPSWFASLFFYFSAFSCFSASLLIYFSASLISAFIGLCACRIFWQCLSLCKILPPMANGIAIFGSKCKILREREIIQREVSVLIDAMPQFQDAGETLMDTQGGSSNECLGNSQCCMIST